MLGATETLFKVFEQKLLRIPDYQRGYAWEDEQLSDFWNDLLNIKPGKVHYTGQLTLQKTTYPENNYWLTHEFLQHYDVVDGQQRLMTCVIFVCALIEYISMLQADKSLPDNKIYIDENSEVTISQALKTYIMKRNTEGNIAYLFDYVSQESPNAVYLHKEIYQAAEETLNTTQTYYTCKMHKAKEFFAKHLLDGSATLEQCRDLYNKLTKQLIFSVYYIDQNYNTYVAFETMNHRGKKLSHLELLKNRLMYLTTLFNNISGDSVNQVQRLINNSWQTIYQNLGQNTQKMLSDDSLLKDHWIVYFTYSRQGNDCFNFLFDTYFTPNKIVPPQTLASSIIKPENTIKNLLHIDDIKNYVISLAEFSKIWCSTFFPENTANQTERLWLQRLQRIGVAYFRPLIVAALIRQSDIQKRILLWEKIERYIFIFFRIGAFRSNKYNSFYYAEARKLYKQETSTEEIIKNLSKDLENESADCVDNFIRETKKRFENAAGYYSWNSLSYLLYEYETKLALCKGRTELYWEDFSNYEKDKISIEHILPQDISDPYWKNLFGAYSEAERRSYTGALGNLLPLSQKINSSLQNISFPKKVSGEGRQRGYKDGSFSEREVSEQNDKSLWDAQCIYDRSLKLIEFMVAHWDISLSKEQKQQLIFAKNPTQQDQTKNN